MTMPANTIGALTTERLLLRPIAMQDHSELYAHWTSPEVRQYLFDGAILSADDVTQVIEGSVRGFAESSSTLWLVKAMDGSRFVGVAGLRPLDDVGVELYYSLAPEAWGRGYATEAARAVMHYALNDLGLHEVLAEVDAANAASVAVVERLGMIAYDAVPGVLGAMTRYRRTLS
jgi:ribosomal-protein-alanine N-acetyltransferase